MKNLNINVRWGLAVLWFVVVFASLIWKKAINIHILK
jgi:hypothetical protein